MVTCFCETKLNKDISLDVMNWTNFNVWRRDRKNKSGGGVVVLTHKKLKAKEIDCDVGDNTELLALEIKCEGKLLDIAVAYMPPHTRAWDLEEYGQLKENMIKGLEYVINRGNELLIVGDFNCKEVAWEERESNGGPGAWGTKLLELSDENLLIQNVKENTRKRGQDEASRLDLAFTRDEDTIESISYLPPVGNSDHVVIKMELNIGYPIGVEEYKEEWYNYYKANYGLMKTYFARANWEELYEETSVEGKYRKFREIYDKAVETYVPKKKETHYKEKPWFNERCRVAKEKRDKAWDIYRKRRGNQTWTNYKRLRNEYTKIRRQEARNYEKNIVMRSEGDPKLFYRHINSKMKKKENIERVKKGDVYYEDDRDICEIMNESLHAVYVNEEEFMAPEIPEGEDAKMDEIDFSPEELLELLKGLDVAKAMGPDTISGCVLKECADELKNPIYDIMKTSLDSGKLPTDWKRANIIPIHKGGSKEEPLNYRPVSLTSILCKICERIIKRRWVKMLEDGGVYSSSQFGFREGTSTVTNLLSYYDRVSDILQEREGWVDCIYLDIKKAFDRVPHHRLIWKIKKYGRVRGKMLEWMTDYLMERKMRTVIRGTYSNWKSVPSGVPQGAVLAPIMFLIYINDMGRGVKSYMNMFADDAKIMRQIENEESCVELQNDLDTVKQWSDEWKLEFNTRKCHVIEGGTSKNRPHWEYKLGNNVIDKTDKEKDLGVIVRGDLSPENHINKIVGEVYGMLNRIRIAFNYIDVEMLAKIIKVMIRPKLEYAVVVWAPHLKKHINKLEKVQRAATRLVPELRVLSYEERLAILGLTTLEKRRERGDMIMMYKCTRGLEKVDRENFIVRDDGRTRGHSYKVKRGRCKGDVKKYSFPYRCIDKWNGLGEEVVCSRNIHEFKENFDKYEIRGGTTRA